MCSLFVVDVCLWTCYIVLAFCNMKLFFFFRVMVKFNVNDSIDDSMLDMPDTEQPQADQPQDTKVCIIFCTVKLR